MTQNRLHILWAPALLSFLLLPGCGKELTPTPPPGQAIGFEVASVEDLRGSTKSIIKDASDLQQSCTPVSEGGGGRSIGIWADVNINGAVTKNIFKGTRLVWKAVGAEGHENNPDADEIGGSPNYWNYESGAVFWYPGEIYTFRAYYPYGEMADAVQSNSDANGFVVVYNAATVQEDFLVAYNKIDLVSQPEKISQHVPLQFRHALSALRFTIGFKSDYTMSDKLTALWLENTGSDQFAYINMLVYGDGTTAGVETLNWTKSYAPGAGVKFFEWVPRAAVPFYRTSANYENAVAYNTGADYIPAVKGDIFANPDNENWLFVAPQQLVSGTQLCFTTEQGGSESVFRVTLPTELHWTEGGVERTASELLPGYRYTFSILISRIDLDVQLTIKPWNELDSNYDITF